MSFNTEIEAFNNKYSFETIKVNNGSFRYLLAGKENTTPLVFLNGGTNSADMWFKYVDDLSKDYKVLIFDYAIEFKNNQDQADGMNKLFSLLNIDKPVLIGASFGGLMAQIYAQKYIDEVSALILLSTASLSEYTLKKLKIKKIFVPLLLMYIKHSNYEKLKKQITSSCVKYVKNESEEVQQYTKDMFEYVFKDYTSEKDYHITSLLADIFTQPPVTKDTFTCLKDKVLLMLPKKDYFSPLMQEDLINIMNNPKVQYVEGGHIATVLDVEVYLKAIRSFLKDL